MYRNLVNQKGSLTLTLPKQWVEKCKLSPKDPVFIIEQENTLLVSAQKSSTKKTYELDVSSLSAGRVRSLLGLFYRANYDELLLTGVTKEMSKQSFSHLVGCVVTEEGSYYKVSFYSKEISDVFPIIDKIMITIGVALESNTADAKEFRLRIMELKDYVIRSLSNQYYGEGTFELVTLVSEFSNFASVIVLESLYEHAQKKEFEFIKKAWLKRDNGTLLDLSEKYYKQRKNGIFYYWIHRIATTACNILLIHKK